MMFFKRKKQEPKKSVLEDRVSQLETEIKRITCDHPIEKREFELKNYVWIIPSFWCGDIGIERCVRCGKKIAGYTTREDALKAYLVFLQKKIKFTKTILNNLKKGDIT